MDASKNIILRAVHCFSQILAKSGIQIVAPMHYVSGFVLVLMLAMPLSSSQAAVFDVEAKGVYGGFWRDLYQFGPVVIDTVGANLGIFISDNVKAGLTFATLVGLLSKDEGDDVFDSISDSSSRYGNVLNALDPADFSYSTAALTLEYLLYEGSSFGWSTSLNLGQGVVGYNPGLAQVESSRLTHNYGSLGIAFIIKFTKNIWWAWGISQRKDLNSNDKSRPVGFENFDAVTIYNYLNVVKF